MSGWRGHPDVYYIGRPLEPHPIPEFRSNPRPSIITDRYRLGILVGALAASLFYGIAHIAFAAIVRML